MPPAFDLSKNVFEVLCQQIVILLGALSSEVPKKTNFILKKIYKMFKLKLNAVEILNFAFGAFKSFKKFDFSTILQRH